MTQGTIKVIENDMYQFLLCLSLSLRSSRMAEPRAKVSKVIQCRDGQTTITEQRTDSILKQMDGPITVPSWAHKQNAWTWHICKNWVWNAFSMLPKTDFTKLLCQQYVLYFLAIALKSQEPYSYHFVRWYKWFIIVFKKPANISAVQSQTH